MNIFYLQIYRQAAWSADITAGTACIEPRDLYQPINPMRRAYLISFWHGTSIVYIISWMTSVSYVVLFDVSI